RVAEARAMPALQSSPIARSILARARLRVAAAAGDVETAQACLDEVRRHARDARAPLEVSRATLVWVRLLRRAGMMGAAGAALPALRRAARVAPPLLRLAIDRELANSASPERRAPEPPRPSPAPLTLVPEIAGPSAALDDLRRAILRA